MATPRPISRRTFTCILCTSFVLLAACAKDDLPTSADSNSAPEFFISDGCHNALVGFYWMLPSLNCSTKNLPLHPDPDLTGLNPVVTIRSCSDINCTTVGAIVAQFTRTTPTPITYKANQQQQYQVTWGTTPTRPPGTYRIDVAAGATGFRRTLGLADVILSAKGTTSQPGQVIGVKLSDPLVIGFQIMIETAGGITIAPTTATISPGGSQQFTATLRNLHGTLLAGRSVKWQTASTPASGVIANLTPTSGPTNGSGQAVTTVTAGSTPGTATVYAISNDLAVPHSPVDLLFATATLTVQSPGNLWTTKASMPTARAYLGATAINGIVYTVGGFDQNSMLLDVLEAYEPATNTWTTKAPLPIARGGHGVGVVGGILYVVGGVTSSGLTNVVEAYDPATDTWTTKAPMPTARNNPAVASINGILYAAGGCGNTCPTAALEAYDPATDTWTTKASMPTARDGRAAGAINGILYVPGGTTSGPEAMTLEAYDPSTNTWSTKASIPNAHDATAAGVINGLLYVVSGSGSGPAVDAYDPATDTWTGKAPIPTERAGLAVGVVNGILYAAGGTFNSDVLDVVEAFQP
jgi:N-acetylneuraminic acid mutarotase